MKKIRDFCKTLSQMILSMLGLITVIKGFTGELSTTVKTAATEWKKLKADPDVAILTGDIEAAGAQALIGAQSLGLGFWVIFFLIALVVTAFWRAIYTRPRVAQKKRYRERLRSEVPGVRRRSRKGKTHER